MITVINYGMGNLGSIQNMLKKIGAKILVTSDPTEIDRAEKIIFPGVGAFDAAVATIQDKGLANLLSKKALSDKVPFLGICLGMQLMSQSSEEGVLPGLGWFKARTKKFDFPNDQGKLKIPHMGWNTIKLKAKDSPLLRDLDEESRFYFVHSYYLDCENPADIAAQTPYGGDFTSVITRENIYGAQFHPEKSHRFGMQIFKNFVTHC
ncbi:MAG: imidazole glycerol phosphate synthase subunit HisH [bacterium]|nr:imidazole glycerol phosphate synthase subunit HisH [bacterium]